MSMLAAASAYKKSNAEELISNCKFDSFHYEKKKPTKKKTNGEIGNDTISYLVGIRKVDNINIVAVWIKGTSRDYEWVSNWNLGTGKTHKGFKIAEKTMNKEIEEYLKKNGIVLSQNSNVRFWITGHSRGAAVANLYAKNMNNKIGKDKVYAYTFACPRVSRDIKRTNGKKNSLEVKIDYKNDNIKNYLNTGDFVTEVAPEKWGYERYGNDIPLVKNKRKAMKKLFKKISGEKNDGYKEGGKRSLVKAFLKYAGKKNSTGYFKKKPKYTPEFFCKEGIGYILAGQDKIGNDNCIKVAKTNLQAAKVLFKMGFDGQFTHQFGHAHTQLSYLCWLKEMY